MPDSRINPSAAHFSFAADGLLRANYDAKPSFAAYRTLIRRLGAHDPEARP